MGSNTVLLIPDAHGRANAATFMDELVQRCQDGKELPVAGRQGAARRPWTGNAATFMDELVQRCQDGKELPVPGRQGTAARLAQQKFSSTSNIQN